MHRYTIEVDGRQFTVDVDEREGDRFGVVVDGQAYDVALTGEEKLGDSGTEPALKMATARTQPAAAAAPRAAASASASASAAPRATPGRGGAGALGAPMPGLILRVLVAPGAQVRRGQDLAVLEAMKMENLIRAPADATVAEVCVKPGQQVAPGEALFRLEANAP